MRTNIVTIGVYMDRCMYIYKIIRFQNDYDKQGDNHWKGNKSQTSILSHVVSLDHIFSRSIASRSCFCTRLTQNALSSALWSLSNSPVAALGPKWTRNSLHRPISFIELYAFFIGRKSRSISMNLPVISGTIEENCEQDTFAVPSFLTAARQLKASIISDRSLAMPESDDSPFWCLTQKDKHDHPQYFQDHIDMLS